MVSTKQVTFREVLGRPPRPPRPDDRFVLFSLAVMGLGFGAAAWVFWAAYLG